MRVLLLLHEETKMNMEGTEGHNLAEAEVMGRKEEEEMVEWFERVSENNVGEVQRQTLRRILELNGETEYVRKWLGKEEVVKEMDDEMLESLYSSSLPLASHSDFDPYIQRIADGDASPLLTSQPVTTLSLSSGTTDGRQKFVPFTSFSSQSTLQIFMLAAAYRSRVLPIRAGGKILEFIYSSKMYKSKGGVTVGLATSHYYASEEFKTKQKRTESYSCSPDGLISGGGDYKQVTYCHLLLGLISSDQVEFVTSTFAYSLVQAFSVFEELWREICDDIRHGTLSCSRITCSKMRRAVLDCIHQHSADTAARLASEIERKCERLQRSDWFGVVPTLWPNAKYVYSIMTGSMQPYLKKLRHYAGDLPLVSADYGSTESWIGVNLAPLDPPESVKFTVIPTFAYFEFIRLSKPIEKKKQQLLTGRSSSSSSSSDDDFEEHEALPLSKIKMGEQYEVVLTTFTGLYRYRLGDVVEVAGFHRNVPQLSFICRRKLILSVNVDKNTEKDLQLVVEKGSSLLSQKTRAEMVDFTSHAIRPSSSSKQPGHYVIYWEIKMKGATMTTVRSDTDHDDNNNNIEDVLSECCRVMDVAFVDYGYVTSRRSNSIGPLELRVVESGTFAKMMEYYIASSVGASMSQYKTPRCTTNQLILSILDRCTIKHFRSTAYSS